MDISRLISRARRSAPTGIDRVEMAYAQHLIQTARERIIWAAMTEILRFGPLPTDLAETFVQALSEQWRHGKSAENIPSLSRRLQVYAALHGEGGLHRRVRKTGGVASYVLVSHHHLNRPGSIVRLRKATGARFVCLVHDLIPMELPEYAGEGQPEIHAARMRTVACHADTVIVNSKSTGEALQPVFDQVGRHPPVVTAHIGFNSPALSGAARPAVEPYFIYVATIEPRKNHLLLLNLWRALVQELGARTPKLVLVGARGWSNASIVDMLDRSTAIQDHVQEYSELSDEAVDDLLSGARALLFPAFAEGFGLPLAEALGRGVPAVCSFIPSLLEVGGDAPEYLDPMDGVAWRQAILDYADVQHPRRVAQVERIKSWQAPSWAAHFKHVDPILGVSPPD